MVDWKVLGGYREPSPGAPASALYAGSFSPDGASWFYAKATALHARALPLDERAADRVVGHQSTGIAGIGRDPARAGALMTTDAAGELRRWTFLAGGKGTGGERPEADDRRPPSAAPTGLIAGSSTARGRTTGCWSGRAAAGPPHDLSSCGAAGSGSSRPGRRTHPATGSSPPRQRPATSPSGRCACPSRPLSRATRTRSGRWPSAQTATGSRPRGATGCSASGRSHPTPQRRRSRSAFPKATSGLSPRSGRAFSVRGRKPGPRLDRPVGGNLHGGSGASPRRPCWLRPPSRRADDTSRPHLDQVAEKGRYVLRPRDRRSPGLRPAAACRTRRVRRRSSRRWRVSQPGLRRRVNSLHGRAGRRSPLGPHERQARNGDRGSAGRLADMRIRPEKGRGRHPACGTSNARATARPVVVHDLATRSSRPLLPSEAVSCRSSSTPPVRPWSRGTKTASFVWAASRPGAAPPRRPQGRRRSTGWPSSRTSAWSPRPAGTTRCACGRCRISTSRRFTRCRMASSSRS